MSDPDAWEVVTAQTPYTVRLAVPGGWLYYCGLQGEPVKPQLCFVPDPAVYAPVRA